MSHAMLLAGCIRLKYIHLLITAVSQLKTEKVDFHLEENRASHHTDEYAMESLIVRRGQEFKVTLTFDRAFHDKKDKFALQLTFGAY